MAQSEASPLDAVLLLRALHTHSVLDHCIIGYTSLFGDKDALIVDMGAATGLQRVLDLTEGAVFLTEPIVRFDCDLVSSG